MTKQTQEDAAVQAVYDHAANLAIQGKSRKHVRADLVGNGFDEQTAQTVTDGVFSEKSKAFRSAGFRDMLFGGLWCGGGTIFTIVTYSMAAGGGTYVVAWGAIAFGAFQFLRGVFRVTTA